MPPGGGREPGSQALQPARGICPPARRTGEAEAVPVLGLLPSRGTRQLHVPVLAVKSPADISRNRLCWRDWADYLSQTWWRATWSVEQWPVLGQLRTPGPIALAPLRPCPPAPPTQGLTSAGAAAAPESEVLPSRSPSTAALQALRRHCTGIPC